MQGSGGLLLIVIALLVIYAGITGKFQCFSGAFRCMFQGTPASGAPGTVSPSGVPSGGLNPINPRFPEYPGNASMTPMSNAGQLLGINFGIGGYQTPPFV